MSFPRHKEIYQSDELGRGRDPKATPSLIGVDESPAGYSLVGALQHCPPPLHQPLVILHDNMAVANRRRLLAFTLGSLREPNF